MPKAPLPKPGVCDDARALGETDRTNASGAIDDPGGEGKVAGGDFFAEGASGAKGGAQTPRCLVSHRRAVNPSLRARFRWIEPTVGTVDRIAV